MYESYWQLEAKPFENTADSRFYYPGEAHQGALLKLRYVIEHRRGAALLTGASGVGKTLLVRTLARQLPEHCSPIVHLVFPQMPGNQLLGYLVDRLTGQSAPAASVHENVCRLEQALEQFSREQRQALVVIDEAQVLAETDGLETVRLLLNFEGDSAQALTVLLVGQPGLLPALERMPELDERLGVKCLLPRLSLEETISYVSHRMGAAGANRAIFDSAALEAVYQLTQGVPRRINRLCDLALLIGFAEEQPVIGLEQIEAVAHELVTVSAE